MISNKTENIYFHYASPVNSAFIFKKLGINTPTDLFYIKDNDSEYFYVPTFEYDYLKQYSHEVEIRDLSELEGFVNNYFEAIINYLKTKKRPVKIPAIFPAWLFSKMQGMGINIAIDDFYFLKTVLYKNQEEVKMIKKTARGVKACFKMLEFIFSKSKVISNKLNYNGSNLSSKSVSALIDKFLLEKNIKADFTVVASGRYSFFSHYQLKHYLRSGEPIIIDIAAHDIDNGYYVDVSRTYCIGQPNDLRMINFYRTVKNSKKILEDNARPGKLISSAYQLSVDYMAKHEVTMTRLKLKSSTNDNFICNHSLGHGVGRDLHQLPVINSNAVVNFEKNMVLAMEPGAYNSKTGGIRLEDTYLITDNGPQNLTKSKYNFIITKK